MYLHSHLQQGLVSLQVVEEVLGPKPSPHSHPRATTCTPCSRSLCGGASVPLGSATAWGIRRPLGSTRASRGVTRPLGPTVNGRASVMKSSGSGRPAGLTRSGPPTAGTPLGKPGHVRNGKNGQDGMAVSHVCGMAVMLRNRYVRTRTRARDMRWMGTPRGKTVRLVL